MIRIGERLATSAMAGDRDEQRMITAAAALILFPALMAFSAFADLLTMTIPNRVSLALIGLFAVFAASLGMTLDSVLWHVACGAAVLVATFLMFNRGWMGGGDAKLASATALWLGFDQLADYALVASLVGGALTLVILALRHYEPRFVSRSPRFAHLCDGTEGVPYGIALAIAGIVAYPNSQIWALLTAA